MVKNISYDNLIGLFPNAFELNYDKIVKIDKDKHNKRITILLLESIKRSKKKRCPGLRTKPLSEINLLLIQILAITLSVWPLKSSISKFSPLFM